MFFFFFVMSIYSNSLLFNIFYNLCFLLTPLKYKPGAAIAIPNAKEKTAVKLKPVQNKKTVAHTLQVATI